jgi:hypothetical protein
MKAVFNYPNALSKEGCGFRAMSHERLAQAIKGA